MGFINFAMSTFFAFSFSQKFVNVKAVRVVAMLVSLPVQNHKAIFMTYMYINSLIGPVLTFLSINFLLFSAKKNYEINSQNYQNLVVEGFY